MTVVCTVKYMVINVVKYLLGSNNTYFTKPISRCLRPVATVVGTRMPNVILTMLMFKMNIETRTKARPSEDFVIYKFH